MSLPRALNVPACLVLLPSVGAFIHAAGRGGSTACLSVSLSVCLSSDRPMSLPSRQQFPLMRRTTCIRCFISQTACEVAGVDQELCFVFVTALLFFFSVCRNTHLLVLLQCKPSGTLNELQGSTHTELFGLVVDVPFYIHTMFNMTLPN